MKENTKSWKDIKDSVYGKKGTERRDELERDFPGRPGNRQGRRILNLSRLVFY